MTLDPWQYRMSLTPNSGRQVGTVWVETGAGLEEVLLEDAHGRAVGLLLGFPIDLGTATRLRTGTHRLTICVGDDVDGFVEHVLEGLAGRFLWLCTVGESTRLFLDAAGQVPCVYDAELGMAASSAKALLTPEAYDTRFDADLHARLGIDGLGWIPGGLTAHQGVVRLLPNHQLDFADFSVARHWPLTPRPDIAPDQAISSLVEIVQIQLAALLKAGDKEVVQALTAGRETRVLLGCARPYVDQMAFVTVDGAAPVDTVMAARIAAGEGLRHRVLPQVKADAMARTAYLRRNGDCIADANASSFPSVAPLAGSSVFIGGAGGEVGRGFFWRPTDTTTTPLDGAALMGRFGLPPVAQVITELDAWVAGLTGLRTQDILDLAYIEQRMAPWGGAQFPSDPTLVRFAPLVTRQGIRAMMALPDAWKRGEGMSMAVLDHTWPEIVQYPFNTLGPWRDGLAKLRKALRDPGVVLRKLRKRFG